MKYFICAVLAGLSLITSVLMATDVAVIYSSWPEGGKSYLLEYDSTLSKMGYKFQKFENTKIPELTSKLDKFDMVIVSTVGNLENTVELKPYAKKWKEYIRKGGILFICDANYPSVLQSFINYFGSDFSLFSEHCSSHTKPTPENKKIKASRHTLFTFPAPVYKIAPTVGHWSHFTKLPKNWIALETCADKKPITVAKSYGNGLIVVTVHGNLKDTSVGPYARDMFTNMIAFTTLKRQGMSVISAEIPSSITQHAASILIEADNSKAASRIGLKVNYTAANGIKEAVATAKVKGKTLSLTAPVKFDTRGAVSVKTTVTLDGKPAMVSSTNLQLPEYLAFKARRVHLYPDVSELTFYFTATPKNPHAKKTLRWNINNGTAENIAISRNIFTRKFDISALPLGKHIINMEYLEDGKVIGTYSENFFKHKTPTVGVRADGTLLCKGKPFFPMGFYHVSRGLPIESRMDMIKDIAKYGYNCVHVSIKAEEKNTNTYDEFLDECAKRGIYVISEFSYDEIESIRRHKNHPAILGWNPGDEPAGNGTTPEVMFRRYSSFKQEDPNHIAYTVICLAHQYKNYASGSDILAPDPYPIPIGRADDVFKIYSSAYLEARKYGTTMWSVPQCFGNYASWTRTPSGQEYRAMVYLALMAGAKGLVNYTYNDGGFYLPSSTELYETCKKLPAELKELIPFILDGERTVLLSSARGIYIAEWKMNGKRAYVVVNASDKELAKPLVFWIKGDFRNCRVPVGKLSNMSATGRGLKATLAPMERALIFCD